MGAAVVGAIVGASDVVGAAEGYTVPAVVNTVSGTTASKFKHPVSPCKQFCFPVNGVGGGVGTVSSSP